MHVTSQIIVLIKKIKHCEKNVIVILMGLAHAGNSKRRVKYRLFAFYAKLML